MAFTKPNFNVLANRWAHPAKPGLGNPVTDQIQVQLYVNTRGTVSPSGTGTLFNTFIYASLRLDYVPGKFSLNDMWEVPAGYGQYLVGPYGYPVHLGFPNEYLEIAVFQCDDVGNIASWNPW